MRRLDTLSVKYSMCELLFHHASVESFQRMKPNLVELECREYRIISRVCTYDTLRKKNPGKKRLK